MFNQSFQEEFSEFKKAAYQYSKKFPALAPMLGKTSTDPDVERLFEGVAFLTTKLNEKLSDDFPEIVHELIRMIIPHYLKPLPAATIIKFNPLDSLSQKQIIPKGTYIDSEFVHGTKCRFKTCYNTEIHPLKLSEVSYAEVGTKPAAIKFLLELNNINVSSWEPEALCFHLAGNYREASQLYLHLCNNLKQISIYSSDRDNISSCVLHPDNLKPVGFSQKEDESLIPYPLNSFQGYRLLQEYFFMPEKFLFFKLFGWKNWKNRGENSKFEIRFELNNAPEKSLEINNESICLFATPAVNIFKGNALPVNINPKKTNYRVWPVNNKNWIYSIDKVTGIKTQGMKTREYNPFHKVFDFEQKTPVYNEIINFPPGENSISISINITYGKDADLFKDETLSFDVTCTNGNIPDNLLQDEISKSTDNSPDFADFTNIYAPVSGILPRNDTNFLWRLLSHLYLNQNSITNAKQLQSVLELYVPDSKNQTSNKNRIQGIKDIKTKPADRFLHGVMLRGTELKIKIDDKNFVSNGDMYIFASTLNAFFGLYSSVNTFTRLIMEDSKGETYKWQARAGEQHLI